MAAERIAVTGATGRIGGLVAAGLLARRAGSEGLVVRLVVRDPTRAAHLGADEVAVADYADGAASLAALEGVDTLFMVSGAEAMDRVQQHETFIDAAVAAGVGRIVYLSVLHPTPDATFTLARDHWATEEHIRASGMRWTFLRDALYADFFAHMVGPDGVIRGPAGDGLVAPVAQVDVADAAVAVLLGSGHDGVAYDLTGPEALSLQQVAALITSVTGRSVSYHPETLAEAYASRASYGEPDWQVDAWVSTYTAIAAGEAASVSDDVERLTGHPATPLAAVLAAATD